jgi:uncharacterized membrane protein
MTMTASMTAAIASPALRPAAPSVGRWQTFLTVLLAAAGMLSAALVAAVLRRALAQGIEGLAIRDVWLAIHLASVIPAIPLGAMVLVRRKGDTSHRRLGRIWGGMMILAAASSFGLHGATGGLSWIHALSVLVLVTVTRGVVQAVRGRIAQHMRSMILVYAGLVVAGGFTLLPGRLLGTWLFN